MGSSLSAYASGMIVILQQAQRSLNDLLESVALLNPMYAAVIAQISREDARRRRMCVS